MELLLSCPANSTQGLPEKKGGLSTALPPDPQPQLEETEALFPLGSD